MELLFEGKISVKAILENQKRPIHTIYMDKTKNTKDFAYIRRLAAQKQIPVVHCSKEQIQEKAHSYTHGGIIIQAGPRPQKSMEELIPEGFLCFVDGVEDPYNLGSICRTLYAAGCQGLILMKRDWGQSETTILKASAGAYEHLNIAWIQQEAELISWLEVHHIPLILAHRKDAVSIYDFVFPKTFCLGVGGALRGLSSQIVKSSTQNLFLEYGRDCRYALDTASAISAVSFEIVRQRRNTK